MDHQATKNFRVNLRTAMKFRGVSQRELAAEAEVSYPHINRILTEKADPTLSMCEKLARAIGLPLVRLLGSRKKFSESLLQPVSV